MLLYFMINPLNHITLFKKGKTKILFVFYSSLRTLVSKREDALSATSLVTMFAMGAFYRHYQSELKGLSLLNHHFPVTSLMVIFIQDAIASISFLQRSMSYGILLLTTILMALA